MSVPGGGVGPGRDVLLGQRRGELVQRAREKERNGGGVRGSGGSRSPSPHREPRPGVRPALPAQGGRGPFIGGVLLIGPERRMWQGTA